MNRREFLKTTALATVALSLGQCAAPAQKPNLILLLADDLGYGDLSCYGSRAIETPYIDQMAAQGMRFTNFYAASAVCSPTRVSCLAGCYPQRFGITRDFDDREMHLPAGTVTLPRLLKQTGYVTGHIGKWHLGGLNVKHTQNRATSIPGPLQHGFDHYLCMYEDPDIRSPLVAQRRLYREGASFLVSDDQPVPAQNKHWTDVKIAAALEFIEVCHQQHRPFFLNLWFEVPHTPYEPAPEPFINPYKDRARGDDLYYRSMVTHLDWAVWEILQKLSQLGIAKNTFILFTSDNGPSYQGSPGPYKGGKADLHEGGIRTPMIAYWPGKIAGGKVCHDFAHTNDILPTFCAAADIQFQNDIPIDGLSLLPLLENRSQIPRRDTVFWQLDFYESDPHIPNSSATEAIRQGDWKLLAWQGQPVELFNLHDDPFERRNLLEVWPEVASQLLNKKIQGACNRNEPMR